MRHAGRRRPRAISQAQQRTELATRARAAESIGEKREGNCETQAALQIKRADPRELAPE